MPDVQSLQSVVWLNSHLIILNSSGELQGLVSQDTSHLSPWAVRSGELGITTHQLSLHSPPVGTCTKDNVYVDSSLGPSAHKGLL